VFFYEGVYSYGLILHSYCLIEHTYKLLEKTFSRPLEFSNRFSYLAFAINTDPFPLQTEVAPIAQLKPIHLNPLATMNRLHRRAHDMLHAHFRRPE